MSMKVRLEDRPELALAAEFAQAGAPVQLERCGSAVVAVLSPEQWEWFGRYSMQQLRESVMATWALNVGVDPEEVEREVAAAVAEVRRERAALSQPG